MLQECFKMLVFDRPRLFPLNLAFCSSVHHIASPFHFIQLHNCLECLGVRLTSMLDTHPSCFSIFVFYARLLQSEVGALESTSRRSPVLASSSRDLRWLGVVWRFPGRRPHLFDRRVVLVLAFLRQPCYSCLYSDTIASTNFVLSSCCIRALVALGL